jgi:lysozyme
VVEELTRQLKGDEAIRLKPYRDTVGKLTIGIGRNLDDDGISENEAELLLWNDLSRTVSDLKTHLPWTMQLDEPRQGVVVNMTFNMGIGRLMQFKIMLGALQSGDYEKAAEEMGNSLWAEEVGARAQRLMVQMRTGVWQYAA